MLVVYWNWFWQSGLNQLVSFTFQTRRIPISISWHPKLPSAMQRWVRRACVLAMGVAVVRWWTAEGWHLGGGVYHGPWVFRFWTLNISSFGTRVEDCFCNLHKWRLEVKCYPWGCLECFRKGLMTEWLGIEVASWQRRHTHRHKRWRLKDFLGRVKVP